MEPATLGKLAASCAEFLVHGVDVEGKQLGIDQALVRLLGQHSPVPVTYAGGVTNLVRLLTACVQQLCLVLTGLTLHAGRP